MKYLLPLLFTATFLTSQSVLAREDAPAETDGQEAQAAKLPAIELTPKLLYRYLLAEIAGQRGLSADSAELHLDLAKETRDPRLARRATEIALHARRPETAVAAARLWLELDPEPPSHARQTLIGLLAVQGRYEDVTKEFAILLASEPQQLSQNLMRMGRFFARGGDRMEVRKLIDKATAPYLDVPEARFARSQAAYEARDLVAARSEIEKALALKPDWESAALLLAQLTEDRSEAITSLTRFVAGNPAAHEARLALARTLVADKRYTDARHEFRALLELNTANNGDIVFAVAMLSLQLGDTSDAEQHLRRLIDLGHAESDKVRYYLGQIAEEKGRYEDALHWFGEVGRGEHYLPARTHAATLLAKRGRIDEARRHLVNSDASTPRERVQLQIGEAQILRDASRLAEAHAVLAEELVRQPDQPELLYEIAMLAEKLGRPDELEKRLRRLLELHPDHAHAHNALGYSLTERNIRLDEAQRLIDRALELAPNDPFILDSKGWVLFRLGKTQDALAILNQAFGLRADPEIAAHIGEVLWVLGRQSEARTTWERARQAFPGNEALSATIKRFLP